LFFVFYVVECTRSFPYRIYASLFKYCLLLNVSIRFSAIFAVIIPRFIFKRIIYMYGLMCVCAGVYVEKRRIVFIMSKVTNQHKERNLFFWSYSSFYRTQQSYTRHKGKKCRETHGRWRRCARINFRKIFFRNFAFVE